MTLLSISVNPEDRKMGRPERMRQPLPHKLTKGLGGGSTELSISLSSADLTPYPQVPKFLLANRFLDNFFLHAFCICCMGYTVKSVFKHMSMASYNGDSQRHHNTDLGYLVL